jgi:hypothetical protein
MIWNVSVVGVYCVLSTPLPAPGETVRLTFTLPGDPAPIICQARVRWQNAPSIFKGCGQTKMALPPGCGIEFTVLDASDAGTDQRTSARDRDLRALTPSLPPPPGLGAAARVAL